MNNLTNSTVKRRFTAGLIVVLILVTAFVIPLVTGQHSEVKAQSFPANREHRGRLLASKKASTAEQRPFAMQTTSAAKVYQPDAMGFALYLDGNSGEKQVISQNPDLAIKPAVI